MDRSLVSEAEIFLDWNFAKLQLWRSPTIPRVQKEQNLRFENTLPVLQTYHALFFFLLSGVRLSEMCPLDLKRANLLLSGAQCDCFVKVSFCNKVISVPRQNETFATF